jgi:predicted XRE-type DNA-binding protein
MTKRIEFDGIPRTELAKMCKTTVQNSGMTQREIADELGVSQPAVNSTFRPDRHLDKLRMRLLREIGGEEAFSEDRLVKYIEFEGTGYVIMLPEDETEGEKEALA